MKRLFRILFAAAFIVCVASGALLFNYYRTNQEGSQEYRSLTAKAVTMKMEAGHSDKQPGQNIESSQQAGVLKNPPALLIDFDQLRKVNPDVAAWIDFPGQSISYPVVQSGDNEHYLKYTFEGKKNSNGCIFADSRNTGLMTDGNTIIYGHNMKSGAMFGMLKKYMEREHYEKFPYFDVYTPDGIYRCEIVACARIQAREENYPVNFSGELERNQYIADMKALGSYEIQGLDSAEEDGPLVLLSTCTGGQKAYRFAVLGRAVKVE